MTTEWGPCPDCGNAELALSGLGPKGEAGPFDLDCPNCPWTAFVPEEASARSRIQAIREIVREHSAKRIDGYLVDAMTASALLALYDALGPEAREKFGKPSLERLVEFTWKHVRVGS